MKLLGRLMPNIIELRAEEIVPGVRLASGVFQARCLSDVDPAGEIVIDVEVGDLREIRIAGCAAPEGFSWALDPLDPVMIEKEA